MPIAFAYDSTTLQWASAANQITSLQNRYLIVGTADGSGTTIDGAFGASAIRQPNQSLVVNIYIEITGNTGARSTNPFTTGESVTWQLRRAEVSGNTWVDAGIITNLTTINSATVFPFRTNVTGMFNVTDQMLYVQETPSALVLPRQIIRTFRFDTSVGNWLNLTTADNRYCKQQANCTGNFTGNFSGNGDNIMTTPNPFDITIGIIAIIAILVALAFASKTNPIPSIISVTLLLAVGALALSNETNLGNNFGAIIIAIVTAIILCAIKMLATIFADKKKETDI